MPSDINKTKARFLISCIVTLFIFLAGIGIFTSFAEEHNIKFLGTVMALLSMTIGFLGVLLIGLRRENKK